MRVLATRLKCIGVSINSEILSFNRGVLATVNSQRYRHDGGHWHRDSKYRTAAAFAAITAGVAASGIVHSRQVKAEASDDNAAEDIIVSCGKRREGLPEFSIQEVGKHDSHEKRIWVIFKSGVYDITDFIPLHPGAEKLLMAAGGSVEPFWHMYAVHLNNKTIYSMLEQYRIGNLRDEDVQQNKAQMAAADDPFANAPSRHPALIVNQQKPFNAETPLNILGDSFLTPQDLMFVRSHLPVPDVDPESYTLEVEGVGCKNISLSLEDIKKLPQVKIVAAVQCGGNRRLEMKSRRTLKGLDWRGGAIGNGEWTGARLTDVLKLAGFDEDKTTNAQHVIFEGLDHGPDMEHFNASIPIEKANDPRGDVILAYQMNGEDISRDHGYPIRVIVPGTVGVRNVKWLARIEVSETESTSHWQKKDYKGFNASTDWNNVDWSKSEAIQDMPVTSSVTSCTTDPATGELIVKGYAWSGGGRKILRVDLTTDGGKTWVTAENVSQDTARHPRHYGWTLWEGRVAPGEEVWSKAVDSSHNSQPETFENIWNLRGTLSHAYCRYRVKEGNALAG